MKCSNWRTTHGTSSADVGLASHLTPQQKGECTRTQEVYMFGDLIHPRSFGANNTKRQRRDDKHAMRARGMTEEKPAKPLSLEEYAGFFHHPHLRHQLSHDQLNQIIYMHRFLKLHRWQKAFIVDALNSLDLMRPERSTLRGQAAAAPAPSLEEAKQDIEALGWQECPVGSILTVSAAADVEAPASISTCPSSAGAGYGDAQPETTGGKKKRRKRMLAAIGSLPLLPPTNVRGGED